MNRKHIAVIGLGGVGGYFGFKINQTNETDQQNEITFIARDKTFEAVTKNGLQLLSPEHQNGITRPDHIYQTISEIKDPQLVLVCVKEYDLENVCNQLKKVINNETIILPMMNGADIYDRIRKIIPDNIILPSCIYVASHIKEKGIVEHTGKAGKLIFGKDPMNFAKDVNWVVQLMEKSNIQFEFKDSSLTDIWTKFFFIASFGLVTAKYNSSIGSVCINETEKEEATKIMKEIEHIAHKKGIAIDQDIISKTFEKAATFPPATPTSLQLDINSGKNNNELELFAGAIIQYGKECNVDTSSTEKIYDEIKASHHIS